uniref:Uncharacterized protein n=1 Tax=Trypanosoma congolense (strain IL3000) TaxID=1068625 RepID=G0UNI9_TRYCI|nr:hypothetical protein, unlikely [Trypanosoma congolense IL3000]
MMPGGRDICGQGGRHSVGSVFDRWLGLFWTTVPRVYFGQAPKMIIVRTSGWKKRHYTLFNFIRAMLCASLVVVVVVVACFFLCLTFGLTHFQRYIRRNFLVVLSIFL